jgi:hypothetical protein
VAAPTTIQPLHQDLVRLVVVSRRHARRDRKHHEQVDQQLEYLLPVPLISSKYQKLNCMLTFVFIFKPFSFFFLVFMPVKSTVN